MRVEDPELMQKALGIKLLIKKACAGEGLPNICEKINVEEAVLRRFLDDGLESASLLLAASGLKVVPWEMKAHSLQYMESLHYLAKVGMKIQEARCSHCAGLM